MLTARTYHAHLHARAVDHVSLTYEDRFLRRKVLTLASGAQLLVDLAHTTSLDDGGALITTDNAHIRSDDVRSDGPDHAADAVRYALLGSGTVEKKQIGSYYGRTAHSREIEGVERTVWV